jgi:hypothetical protein
MATEKVRELIDQGNLINLNTNHASLTALLNEVAAMLVEQQKAIQLIKKDLSERVPREEFSQFREQIRSEREYMIKSIPNADALVKRIGQDLDRRQAKMKAEMDDSMSTVLMAVDTRISQKVDFFQIEQELMRKAITSMENKVIERDKSEKNEEKEIKVSDIVGLDSQLEEMRCELSSLKDEIRDRAVGDAVNSDDIQALKEEMMQHLRDVSARTPGGRRPSGSGHLLQRRSADGSVDEEKTPETTSFQGVSSGRGQQSPIVAYREMLRAVSREGADNVTLTELENSIAQFEDALREQGKDYNLKLSRKADVTLVERMFEKVRIVVASLKSDFEAVLKVAEKYVERREMRAYVDQSMAGLLETDQTGLSRKPLKCMACGRPRLRATGAETFVAADHRLPNLSQK